jgi:ubiquinone biosynthesis protein UbiJ
MINTLLEQAINHLLSMDESINFSEIHHKIIQINVIDTPIKPFMTTMLFQEKHIHFLDDYEGGFDVNISMPLATIKDLAQKSDVQQLLREEKITINGDIRTAQLMLDILKNINIDFEKLFKNSLGKFTKKSIVNKMQTMGSKLF